LASSYPPLDEISDMASYKASSKIRNIHGFQKKKQTMPQKSSHE
jgi:hypothetical protein